VSGKVFVILSPYRFEMQGLESKHDLMKSGFGDYGETVNEWSADDVKGFTKILANSLKIYNKVNNKI
jgi:argininosuccinate synthase